MHDDGIIVSAPPCSLMGPACASVHCRSVDFPEGDLSNFKVRLSQRIWLNWAIALMLICWWKPSLFHVAEQPSGSWGYKQPYVRSIFGAMEMLLG